MAAHLRTAGGIEILQPVAIRAVGQQDRHARLSVNVGVEQCQRGAVGLAGAPAADGYFRKLPDTADHTVFALTETEA